MNIRIFIIAVILCTLSMLLYAQMEPSVLSEISVEGRILDKKDHKPIAYAHVYDKSSGKGTLSNLEGYFRLNIKSRSDSVIVSIIGYKNKAVNFQNKNLFYEILLEERILLLKEVNITAGDDSYLYELLADCRKKQSKKFSSSKVYYELKSFVNNHQMELVECFYNGTFIGYDLSDLDLKYGRIALQQNEKILFVSVETSRAIAMLKLFNRNEYLPFSPLELSKKMMKENYYLYFSNKYYTDEHDSVYIVDFKPKNNTGSSFNGQIWINYTNKNVIKIKLNCPNATQHPFLPLTATDTIKNVDIEITKTFQEVNGTMFFKHIDFGYDITYKNRENSVYKVSTAAILYSYDTNSLFAFPCFTFADASDGLINYNLSDYLKINTIPYNDFFWKNNQELKLNEEKNQNELFYNDAYSITNKTYNPLNEIVDKGLLEQSYLIWSSDRIKNLKFTIAPPCNIDPAILDDIDSPVRIEEKCDASVKIFLDVNSFQGKFYFNALTVLDPYESFYNYPINNRILCFINIYFDLMEIERRTLVSEIEKSDKSSETLKKLYKLSTSRIQELNQRYFKDRTYGKNQKEMKIWNDRVVEQLGINNIELFNPFADKK